MVEASVMVGVGALLLALIWFLFKAIAGHWLAHKIFASLSRRRRKKPVGNPADGYTESNQETKNEQRQVDPRS